MLCYTPVAVLRKGPGGGGGGGLGLGLPIFRPNWPPHGQETLLGTFTSEDGDGGKKRLLNSEFAFFQSLSRLFQLINSFCKNCARVEFLGTISN